MKGIGLRFLLPRIKSIAAMMKDKNVPLRKKLLVVLGFVYVLTPVDVLPVVLGPFAIVDDAVVVLWIITHLKDTLDQYWVGESEYDMSKDFKKKDLVDDVEFTVSEDDSTDN